MSPYFVRNTAALGFNSAVDSTCSSAKYRSLFTKSPKVVPSEFKTGYCHTNTRRVSKTLQQEPRSTDLTHNSKFGSSVLPFDSLICSACQTENTGNDSDMGYLSASVRKTGIAFRGLSSDLLLVFLGGQCPGFVCLC